MALPCVPLHLGVGTQPTITGPSLSSMEVLSKPELRGAGVSHYIRAQGMAALVGIYLWVVVFLPPLNTCTAVVVWAPQLKGHMQK